MKKTEMVAGLIAGLVIGVAPVSAASAPTEYHGPKNPPRWMTTPCQGENDYDCFKKRKRKARSYWAIPLSGGDVAIVYWGKRYNLRHGFVTGR